MNKMKEKKRERKKRSARGRKIRRQDKGSRKLYGWRRMEEDPRDHPGDWKRKNKADEGKV